MLLCGNGLTLCQTTIFRLFELKEFADDNFEFDKISKKVLQEGRKHCGKRRNCSFQKICTADKGLFGKGLRAESWCRKLNHDVGLALFRFMWVYVDHAGLHGIILSGDALTHYQTTNFRLFQTERVCRRQFQISRKWKKVIQIGRKQWEKEKWLVTSNFSFSHSVFKRLVSQGRQKVSLCGNGLTLYHTIQTFNKPKGEGFSKHRGRRRKC